MYENLLRILLGQQHPGKFERALDPQTEFLIRNAWAKRGTEEGTLLSCYFKTKAALVGIGAPLIYFYLPWQRRLGRSVFCRKTRRSRTLSVL